MPSGAASVEQSSSAPPAAPAVPLTLASVVFEQAGLLSVIFEDWTVPPEPFLGPHQCHLRLASAICSTARAVLRDRAIQEAQLERTRELSILRQCALYLEVDLISTVIFQAAEQRAQLLSAWICVECGDDGDLTYSGRDCAECRGPAAPRCLSPDDQLFYAHGFDECGDASTWSGIGASVQIALRQSNCM